MSALPHRIDAIYDAIASLESAAEFVRWTPGRDNYERARDMERTAREAMQQYRLLSDAMPRIRSLDREAAVQYDRYVTRMPGGCSCHLSAPCSFCTSEADEEEAA